MANLNLITAWLWVGLGFLSGLVLGLRFDGEQWLGGYGSWKRRLYRLGHISFFGLGMVNWMFYFTARVFPSSDWCAAVASIGYVAGAFTMPLCCFVAAHFRKANALFAVPVVSLLIAVVLTIAAIGHAAPKTTAAANRPPSMRFATPRAPSDSQADAATTALAANGL